MEGRSKKTASHLVAIALLFCTAPAFGASFVAAVDGDTLLIKEKGEIRELHLAKIDAPELGQPGGEEARDAVAASFAPGEEIRILWGIRTTAQGQKAEVLADGRSLSWALVEEGLAWAKDTRDPISGALYRIELEARKAQRGIWAQPAEEPWIWRERRGLQELRTVDMARAAENAQREREHSERNALQRAQYRAYLKANRPEVYAAIMEEESARERHEDVMKEMRRSRRLQAAEYLQGVRSANSLKKMDSSLEEIRFQQDLGN